MHRPRKINYKNHCLFPLLRGIRKASTVISPTLGPKGRPTMMEKAFGAPNLTKNSLSIIQELELAQTEENLGVRLLKIAAEKTHHAVGDGVATLTVLTEAMVTEGVKLLTAGYSARNLVEGMQWALTETLSILDNIALKDLNQEQKDWAGKVAADYDDETANLVGQAMNEVGFDGVIKVINASGIESSLTFSSGVEIPRGPISRHFFIDQESKSLSLDKPLLLLTDHSLSNVYDILKVLEGIFRTKRHLLIIAEDVSSQALATLILNQQKKQIRCCALKLPDFGEKKKSWLEDLSLLSGTSFISKELGQTLQNTTIDDLCTLESAEIWADRCVLGFGNHTKQNKIQEKIAYINHLWSEADPSERYILEERKARLQGKIATIEVGGGHESELRINRERMQSCVTVLGLGLKSGVVPGGCISYIQCQKRLSTDDLDHKLQPGAQLFQTALTRPLEQMLLNAKKDPTTIIHRLKESEQMLAYDIKGDCYRTDPISSGLLDPVDVCRTVLIHATHLTMSLLKLEAMVTEMPFDPNEIDLDQPVPEGFSLDRKKLVS